MLRKTLISIAVSGALYVSSSYALELGELTSQSTFGEPYRGKIALSDVGALLPNDILIRLGSESEFRQAGLAPTSVLSKLKFDVAREENNLVVEVRSDKPLNVNELHFVLAARWPSGQVVREYQAPLKQTVLVDKSQEEVVQSSKLTPATTPATTQSVFREATVAAKKMPVKGTLGVVKGNTLWSIAGQNQPSNQLTIYQTMMAIQALNKDAFSANNVNLLKEGAILRLPTQDQIALFNRSVSKQEFERQHEAWIALKGGERAKGVEQAQLNAQAKAKPASNKPVAGSDKLTLAAGQSALPEKSASSNAGNTQALMDLKNELSASQEMLDKERREKAELSTRLDDLNKQFETLNKLIALKDKQMAELQQQFASAQQALQEQKNTVDQLLEADQIRREKELAEADSLMNKIFGNPIILSIGAVILVLLGFLVGLVMRRAGKKRLEKEELADDEFDLSPAAAAAIPTVAAGVYSASAAEESVEEPEEDSLTEEDPFAFDFDAADEVDESDGDEALDEFGSFDSEIASVDEPQGVEFDFSESSDSDVDDLDDTKPEEDAIFTDDFAAFDGTAEPEVEPEPEVEEMLADTELSDETDLDSFTEEEVPTVEPVDELEEGLENSQGDADISEEESFVSSLLDDTDQEDSDEASIFDKAPNESLASSIEESLAEAQDDLEEPDVPEFGEVQAAEDEEVSDDEEEFDFFDASGDEAATKLDLARAYMDMGDEEGARVILEDVVESGNEQQTAEAKNMMERMFPSD